MIDVAFIACSLALGRLDALTALPTPSAFIVAPPTRDGVVEFDPSSFLELTLGATLPIDLLTRETVGLVLVSRTAHDGGAFYQFEDPLFPAATASLFLRDERLTGAIYHGGTLRTVLRAMKAGVSSLTIEDAALDLPCGCTGHDMQGQPGPLGGDGGLAGACDTGGIVDVLVVYTSAAVTQQGSEPALLDQIAWGIADSNAIYAGSGIGLNARLVGTSLLAGYVENADMGVDLNRLSNNGDGWIDGVHALRDSVGADLVALVRADGGGYCGVAWLLPSNSSAESPSGFSVTALGCFSNRTFTHEMGHNMGCCHALGDGGGCLSGGVFSYSVGHRFFGLDSVQYRTVMAYSPGTRIPRFSSPLVNWAGTPTGIAGSKDNARTINETRFAFANFRCSADGTGNCGSGGGCYSAHPAPGCNDSACCTAVCVLDNYCCLNQWDAICATAAVNLCSDCGEGSAGDCFVSHPAPSCNDGSCCTLVCAADPFCCTTSWDALCVSGAIELCPNCGDAETGSCYLVHAGRFCDNATCCDAVCAVDAYCCNVSWDYLCANAAVASCPGCGNPNTGSCYEIHTTPYCADAACCTLVCAADPFCCNTQWDSFCANAATANCPGCGNPGADSCYTIHATPYCADATCCTNVCGTDPFCCNVAWDLLCTNEAAALCPGCGNPNSGSCYEAHTTPYCADAVCCATVCALDPWCCNNSWDSICANEAVTSCPGCGNPSAGDCTIAHATAYCQDATCCAQVCAVDVFCCNSSWDSFCASQAIALCVNTCAGSLANDCCVAHANPSCNEAACCSAVCAIDSFCCTNSWDSICANRARVMCGQCCATDLNFDGVTNASDLSTLLGSWGTNGGDCNNDGTTNAADLSIMLGSWGPCL